MRLRCNACGAVVDDLLERSTRDDLHMCLDCGTVAMSRVFMAPQIRTSDSATYLDGGTRLAGVKENILLRKAKADARERKDRVSELKINKEVKILSGKE